MSEVILDASALLAMLKEEPGGTKVAGSIASARMSMINYAEVVSHFVHLGMPERDVDAMLDPLPLELVSLDRGTAQIAGRLRAITAESGLSLGDRCCLALAVRDGLPAWTADKAWRTIADRASVKVVVIR
ncbi:type II toxin-antitoxin system VapC family toxin [Sphingomonas sp. YL-JM2C]